MQDTDSICEIQNDLDFETNSTRSESSDGGNSSSLALGGHTKLHKVCDVTPVSLAASLVAIVSKHNGSDAFLSEALFKPVIGTMVYQISFQRFISKVSKQEKNCRKWWTFFLKFRSLLVDIAKTSLQEMLTFVKNKPPNCDIRIPSLTLVKDRIILRLILNTDGANVSKSPPLSAWPVFFAFVDLPPIKQQLFQNIVLV